MSSQKTPQDLHSSEKLHPVFQSFAKKYKLTARETSILRVLVLKGLRNEELASHINISPKTLKNHISNIMKKTNSISSRGIQALFFTFLIEIAPVL